VHGGRLQVGAGLLVDVVVAEEAGAELLHADIHALCVLRAGEQLLLCQEGGARQVEQEGGCVQQAHPHLRCCAAGGQGLDDRRGGALCFPQAALQAGHLFFHCAELALEVIPAVRRDHATETVAVGAWHCTNLPLEGGCCCFLLGKLLPEAACQHLLALHLLWMEEEVGGLNKAPFAPVTSLAGKDCMYMTPCLQRTQGSTRRLLQRLRLGGTQTPGCSMPHPCTHLPVRILALRRVTLLCCQDADHVAVRGGVTLGKRKGGLAAAASLAEQLLAWLGVCGQEGSHTQRSVHTCPVRQDQVPVEEVRWGVAREESQSASN